MLVIDLSRWNSVDSSKMERLKAKGCQGAWVQLTAGTGYPNPLAKNQLSMAMRSFGWVGAYHYYYGDYKAESAEFLSYLRHWKISTDAPVAIDVEDSSLIGKQTDNVNRFLDILKDHGYRNLYTYSQASWFWGNSHLDRGKLKSKLWVASYGASSPNVDGTSVFQFTDNWKGEHVDASLVLMDLDSFKGTQVKVKSHYYSDGKKFKVIADIIHGFNDLACKERNGNNLAQNSTVHGKPVKIGNGVYRLSTKSGYYTANAKFIAKVK